VCLFVYCLTAHIKLLLLKDYLKIYDAKLKQISDTHVHQINSDYTILKAR